jgi:hypothetical protein
LKLDIPGDFPGERIEIPSSTTDVFFRAGLYHKSSLLVCFDQNSRLRSFRALGGRFFVRFCEATLKYWRDERNED